MRKSKTKILISSLILTFLILCAAVIIIVLGKKMIDEKNEKIISLEVEMNANKQTVYVASADIKAGETVSEGINCYSQTIYSGIDSYYYMEYEDLDSIAVIDIPYGEPIMKSGITQLKILPDSREYEMTVASLMTDQTEYDYVDVRIMFPNGEDFVVLSKKPIINLSLDSCLFYTYLNEDEILRMASATVDAYTITGTRIYTTRYIETNLQGEATPNYCVKAETLDLINSDPNITKIATTTMSLRARMDLEARLKSLTDEQLEAVSAGHGLTDTAKNAVLLDNTYTKVDESFYDTETTYGGTTASSEEDVFESTTRSDDVVVTESTSEVKNDVIE